MTKGLAGLAVTVIIPTHNPRMDYLRRVLEALRVQTLEQSAWELVVVDNGSRVPLKAGAGQQDNRSAGPQDCGTSLPSHIPTFPPSTAHLDLGWHPHARVVREERLGLTFARLRGFAEAKGELIVMVDDDNVLAPDYLETAVRSAEDRPELGAFGGKCLPEFEHEPPEWLAARGKGLGLRDRGEREEFFPEAAIAGSWQPSVGSLQSGEDGRLTAESANRNIVEIAGGKQVARRPTDTEDGKLRLTEFPDCAPIGAGMVLRRDAAAAYAERIEQRTTGPRDNGTAERMLRSSELRVAGGGSAYAQIGSGVTRTVITDRKGDSLASGGDNDICLTALEHGWQVGYLPQLQLTHLIPKERMTLDYHKRMARDSMKSFILMLDQHGIRPWPAMAKWTVPLRVASDWWRVKPWQGAEHSLRFWGHIGMYEGRAALRSSRQRPQRAGDRRQLSKVK